jgi:hypothetical protein
LKGVDAMNAWRESPEGLSEKTRIENDPSLTLMSLTWEKQQAADMLTEYRSQLAKLNTEMRSVKSELKAQEEKQMSDASILEAIIGHKPDLLSVPRLRAAFELDLCLTICDCRHYRVNLMKIKTISGDGNCVHHVARRLYMR